MNKKYKIYNNNIWNYKKQAKIKINKLHNTNKICKINTRN